jgi:hypothetical protein
MPKKSSIVHDKVDVVPFHSSGSYTLSSGTSSIPIYPASFSRVASIGETFCLYRFSKLEYRIMPNSTITVAQGAAYEPGITDTDPTTLAALSEGLNAVILSIRQTVPSDWARLNRSDLMGYLPWYKTVAGSTTTEAETQGEILLVGTGTEVVFVEVRGVCEFKNPISAGSTPMVELKQKALDKERERLLYILASGRSKNSPTATGSRAAVP